MQLLSDPEAYPGADPEYAAATRDFVQGAELHGNQARVPSVGIDHADPDSERLGPARHRSSQRKGAAEERVFKNPKAPEPGFW